MPEGISETSNPSTGTGSHKYKRKFSSRTLKHAIILGKNSRVLCVACLAHCRIYFHRMNFLIFNQKVVIRQNTCDLFGSSITRGGKEENMCLTSFLLWIPPTHYRQPQYSRHLTVTLGEDRFECSWLWSWTYPRWLHLWIFLDNPFPCISLPHWSLRMILILLVIQKVWWSKNLGAIPFLLVNKH